MRRATGVLTCVLLLACGRDAPSPEETAANELGRLLDGAIGGGMDEVGSATGPMTAPLAARATAVHAAELEPWLGTHGFQGGYSRVWREGDGANAEIVTTLVYRFFADRNATEFVAFSMSRIGTSAYFQPFDDPAVPGSRGYTLTSRVAKSTKFCAGEYFTVARDAYVVTRCAPYPVPPHAVTDLAQRQLVHAVTAGGSR
jgi:hypothetical protein